MNSAIRSHGLVSCSQGLVIRSLKLDNPFFRTVNLFLNLDNSFSQIAIRSLKFDSPFYQIAIRSLDLDNLFSRLKSREKIAIRENELSNSREGINNSWELILNSRERIAQFDITIYICYFFLKIHISILGFCIKLSKFFLKKLILVKDQKMWKIRNKENGINRNNWQMSVWKAPYSLRLRWAKTIHIHTQKKSV